VAVRWNMTAMAFTALSVGIKSCLVGSNTMKQELIKEEDTCYDCKHYQLCFLRRKQDELFQAGAGMLNIDGNKRPGGLLDFFKVLACSCFKFEYREDNR